MAGRLFLTGDCHQSLDIDKLINLYTIYAKDNSFNLKLDREDIVVILGDAGFVWNNSFEEKSIRHWISDCPWTTFCVQGNHENFSLINKFPTELYKGGLVKKIAKNLYYGITGEVYSFNGRRCLVVNGADSIDKEYRIEGLSWWPQETIMEADIDNILSKNPKINYIFSHTGGGDICRALGFNPTVSDWQLDKVLENIPHKRHFCGHYHVDKVINEKQIVLYNQVIELRE